MINVTCAIILKDDKVLVTQRSEKMNLPQQWEFPGGKIEENETPENCLIREIKEELDIEIEIIESLTGNHHDYNSFSIFLIPFIAVYKSGVISLLEHKTYKWFTLQELPDLDWAPADIPILNNFIKSDYCGIWTLRTNH